MNLKVCSCDSFGKGIFPFLKGEKPRCLAGEGLRLPFEGKKIPAHMTCAALVLPSLKQSRLVLNSLAWSCLSLALVLPQSCPSHAQNGSV
jgi:hypothetical protein